MTWSRRYLETFDEMHAEAQVTPIVLTFPPEVIERVVAYTKDRSVKPATLIPLRSRPWNINWINSAKRASALWKIPIRSSGLWKILCCA